MSRANPTKDEQNLMEHIAQYFLKDPSDRHQAHADREAFTTFKRIFYGTSHGKEKQATLNSLNFLTDKNNGVPYDLNVNDVIYLAYHAPLDIAFDFDDGEIVSNYAPIVLKEFNVIFDHYDGAAEHMQKMNDIDIAIHDAPVFKPEKFDEKLLDLYRVDTMCIALAESHTYRTPKDYADTMTRLDKLGNSSVPSIKKALKETKEILFEIMPAHVTDQPTLITEFPSWFKQTL